MRNLIAILTGLHVLAHGIFGCCDHGRATAGTKASACVCHHPEHGEHEHGKGSDHDDGHADDQTGKSSDCLATDGDSPASAPHRCIHASCHWLAADVAADQLAFDFNHLVALDARLASFVTPPGAASFWPDNDACGFSAPPLRLHLALGVLLI